jgi:adenosylcobinamide-phosphate synthase
MMESVLIVALAVGIDLAAGDPRNRYHPTAWIGRMIAWVATRARTGEPLSERLGGVALVALPCGAVLAALAAISLGIGLLGDGPAALILSVAAGAILLKSTIAVREMERHAREVAGSVTGGSIGTARGRLATIVKRDTKHLDREHVISGAIESVSENTVDGV